MSAPFGLTDEEWAALKADVGEAAETFGEDELERHAARGRRQPWNRCDVCGKFIALANFDRGAVRRLVTPDTVCSAESYETLCIECAADAGGAA